MTASASPQTSESATSGHILRNLMLFAGVLRKVGLDVGSGNVLDLVRAVEYAPIGRKQDFRQAARCILVHRRQDLQLFDEAFQIFWRIPPTKQSTLDIRAIGEERRYRQPQITPPPAGTDDEGLSGESPGAKPGDVDLTRTYSAREVLRSKDFAEFSAAEITAAQLMMAELSWDPGRRRTRRLESGSGAVLDLRKTLRRNLKYGGELLELAWRQPKEKTRPLVLICDVSGSMERYTRMLLHFIHSIARKPARVEAFLFATRLTRITRFLTYRSIDQAVNELAKSVPDWAGGTRIGQAVKTFNFQWLRRVLGGGAVVLIISDGWDRGEPELLAREMSRLQRSCHRVIWLNPLLGDSSYQPLTRGMQAALPYVDDFLPVNNLNSLDALARHLNNLNAKRNLAPAYRPPKTGEPEPELPEPRVINPALTTTFRHPMWGRGSTQ